MLPNILMIAGVFAVSLNVCSNKMNSQNQLFQPDVVLTTVRTPNGTEIEAFRVNNDMEEYRKRELENDDLNKYPGIALLAPATQKYNCHSYARHDQSPTNIYRIHDPREYWEDGSYIESNGSPGDKVVYYEGSSFIHSGIISERIGSYEGSNNNPNIGDLDNVIIHSKWANSGVFEHKGSVGPYNNVTKIKYYKVPEHNHDFTYEWIDYKKHEVYCSCMVKPMIQGHFVAGGSFDSGERYASCLRCGGLAEMGLIINPMAKNSEFNYINGRYYVKETKFIDGILNLSYEDYQYFLSSNL